MQRVNAEKRWVKAKPGGREVPSSFGIHKVLKNITKIRKLGNADLAVCAEVRGRKGIREKIKTATRKSHGQKIRKGQQCVKQTKQEKIA